MVRRHGDRRLEGLNVWSLRVIMQAVIVLFYLLSLAFVLAVAKKVNLFRGETLRDMITGSAFWYVAIFVWLPKIIG